MPKYKTTLKPVRPFIAFSKNYSTNQDFLNWKKDCASNLCIELGCGAGLHPIQWTKQNPEKSLLAIERTKNKYQRLQQRQQAHNHSNLYTVNADAENWLPLHIGKQEVSHYYILYPNPYPKEKQANKRWHRNPCFSFIIDSLATNGIITIATNERWLFNETQEYCQDYWGLTTLESGPINPEGFLPRSHFEKKYLSRSQNCFNMVFQKSNSRLDISKD